MLVLLRTTSGNADKKKQKIAQLLWSSPVDLSNALLLGFKIPCKSNANGYSIKAQEQGVEVLRC